MITALLRYLLHGPRQDVIGSLLPQWTAERIREAEDATAAYLGTSDRIGVSQKPWVKDAKAIARREARVLEMAEAAALERSAKVRRLA